MAAVQVNEAAAHLDSQRRSEAGRVDHLDSLRPGEGKVRASAQRAGSARRAACPHEVAV